MLGTVDSFVLHKEACRERFVDDYVDIVHKYQTMARVPRIILAISLGDSTMRSYGPEKNLLCPPDGTSCADLGEKWTVFCNPLTATSRPGLERTGA
jgi:hypothetical protein